MSLPGDPKNLYILLQGLYPVLTGLQPTILQGLGIQVGFRVDDNS